MSKTKAKPVLYPLSRRAVIQRVNRILKPRLETLRTWRHSDIRYKAGDLYHLDLNHNCIISLTVDLESFARELGAMQKWETIIEDEE
jgi:hypothetical protein